MTTKSSIEKKPSAGKKKDTEHTIRSLEQEKEKLQNELKQKHDQLLRSLADFQNLQKRSEKERNLYADTIKEKYISEIIDIKELLQKALLDENPKDGLRLILQQIEQFFETERIQGIDCIGKEFDHRKHHAVTTVEKDDCTENIIIEEIKKGYVVDEKVLRPSHVIVSKKKS